MVCISKYKKLLISKDGVRSIRVFSHFSLDPYYQPLLWFMIHLSLMTFTCNNNCKHNTLYTLSVQAIVQPMVSTPRV